MQAKLGTTDRRHTILIIGISRGIGRGLAAEYLRRGWFVIGTVRSSTAAADLEAMAAGTAGRLRVERLDMTRPSEIGALRAPIRRRPALRQRRERGRPLVVPPFGCRSSRPLFNGAPLATVRGWGGRRSRCPRAPTTNWRSCAC